MRRWALLLILAVCPAVFGQTAAETSQPFSLSLEKPSVQVWGRGIERPRFYFAEFLPGNFARTLHFDSAWPQDVTVHWLFTGPRGSLSVAINRQKLTVVQQYYDSFALGAGNSRRERYPRATWKESSATLEDDPATVTVTLQHLTATVSVNGRVLIHELCLIDLMRHQLFVDAPDSSAGFVRGNMTQPAAARVRVSIASQKSYQTIVGFGGITSIPAYDELTIAGKAKWWKLLREYNLLIQREYPVGAKLNASMNNFDWLQDASPHYYGDNFPDGEISDFAYNKHLRAMGGKVFFEFWALPPWARDPQTGNAEPDKYVQAVLAYCRESLAKAGAPPDVVGIQNEIIQPGPVWEQMIARLRRALDDAGFRQVKLHMPDAGSLRVGIRSANTLRQMSDAWPLLDYSATHVYDFQAHMTDPESYLPLMRQWAEAASGKPFLATELAINDSAYQVDSYQTALAMGELYYQLLTVANAESLDYCWLLLDPEQPSFGFTRSLFTVDRLHSFEPSPSGFQLRVFGAFSRHLREGMVRLDLRSSDPDLLATAFRAASGATTWIFLNRSAEPKEIELADGGRVRIQTVEHASLYQENAIDAAPHKSLIVAPGEILTVTTIRAGR